MLPTVSRPTNQFRMFSALVPARRAACVTVYVLLVRKDVMATVGAPARRGHRYAGAGTVVLQPCNQQYQSSTIENSRHPGRLFSFSTETNLRLPRTLYIGYASSRCGSRTCPRRRSSGGALLIVAGASAARPYPRYMLPRLPPFGSVNTFTTATFPEPRASSSAGRIPAGSVTFAANPPTISPIRS